MYTLVIVSMLMGSGVHSTTLDFKTRAACEHAAKVARYHGQYDVVGRLNTIAYCVERP